MHCTFRPCIGTRLNKLYIITSQDAIGSVILALFLLSGAAPSASYSSQWGEPPTLCDESISSSALTCNDIRLTGLMGGLAVSYFIAVMLRTKPKYFGLMQNYCDNGNDDVLLISFWRSL